ncbi:MAG: hypothetical protein E4H40_02100 [Candidatus Brocadiia bacterium]|nr:MAG: hypothetical protein E4H40_02100 [Candidatus Brocadiia bacterium]
MEKMSIWKRFGGWLRRSQTSKSCGEVVHLDAEGLLVDPAEDYQINENSSMLPARNNKKEQPLAMMEDGFNRLVEVLESINNNVVQQREHNAEMVDKLSELSDSTRTLPQSVESQSHAAELMTDEIKKQSLYSQQLAETIKSLPELNHDQLEKLGDIARHLEKSTEAELQRAESFNQFGQATQGLLNNSKAQTLSLTNIGRMLEQNEQQLLELSKRQSRRFAWLLAIVLAVSLAAAGAVAAMLIYYEPKA